MTGLLDRSIVASGPGRLNVAPAASTIAAQVLGVPIVVPEPGEYVARGAAVQAAWALTGTRPEWRIATHADVPADPQPQVRAAYAGAP